MKKESINIIAVILTVAAGLLLDFGLPNVPISLQNGHIDSFHQLSGCIFHPTRATLTTSHLLASGAFFLALSSFLVIRTHSAVALKCICLLAVVSIVGLDSIVLVNILIFNLILLVYEKERNKKTTLKTALLSIILLGIIIYNGESSVIWIVAAIYFTRDKLGYRHAALLLIPAIVCLILIPQAPITPHLPRGAQVVADDGVAGLLRPLFGPNAPDYQLCNRAFFKQSYFFVNFIFLISFSLLFLLARKLPQNIFVLAIIASADVILPESLVHIMPIATLQRLIPGYFFIPLQLYVFSLLLIRASCLVSDRVGTLLLGLCLVFIVIFSPTSRIISQNRRYSLSQFPTASQSPLIASHDYVKPLRERKKYSTIRSPLKAECSNPLDCKAVVDRSRAKRWYTRGQFGTEHITLRLARTQKIAGVRLYQDDFFSDFPRKIQVVDCTSNITVVPSYDWLGSLYRTPRNEVYFASQANAVNILLFKMPVFTTCIMIKQIGYDPIHDWSTTEIELFK